VAFAAVKAALLDLVALGSKQVPDFAEIDANPLSQMFKAKILSLYYPESFLSVCSAEHLEMLGGELGFPEGLQASRYQSLLLDAKRGNPTTRRWTEPKFMAYLYQVCSAETSYSIRRHTFPGGIHDANRPKCPQL
jgi:hypothetical protein